MTLPKTSVLPLALLFFATFASAEPPKRIIVPDFELIGSQLIPILNSSFDETTAVAFRSLDAMRETFPEEIANARYRSYVYFDRGVQVSSFEEGGYIGDFIDKAKISLGEKLSGYVVPIRNNKLTRSSMTANNVLQAYVDTIALEHGYDLIFLVEYSFRKTIEKTEIFQTGTAQFAFVPDHYDAMALSRQKSFYKKFGQSYEPSIGMPIDLRQSSYSNREDLQDYLESIEGRQEIVLFSNSQSSFTGLADYIESQSATAPNP